MITPQEAIAKSRIKFETSLSHIFGSIEHALSEHNWLNNEPLDFQLNSIYAKYLDKIAEQYKAAGWKVEVHNNENRDDAVSFLRFNVR